MSQRYPPINPRLPHLIHGGDYNPDQWMHRPDILEDDMRLMKLAGFNAVSIGIFSWVSLEPEDGVYTFEWLDDVMDMLTENDIYAVLATPSGSKPAWLSAKYPEVCRVTAEGRREPHTGRHNHCRTSPIYREKCIAINTRLAERYQDHPALLVWHVSNEYNGGPCYCDLCLDAFRQWLREKYDDDLELLNRKWWTRFWSHTYTDWDQIEPIDPSIHGLMLDWKRFLTDQTIDFFETESAPLREHTPDVPITTNFMGLSPTLNYWKFAKHVDVASWDSYPAWHDTQDDPQVAAETAFTHDVNRRLKGGKPFMLMESDPSFHSRHTVRKRKRPGMHKLASLQAIAHGSDTVQYFQWRKGRGGSEKFHGAVVDHCGQEHTRVFQDVAEVGQTLQKLDAVVGTTTPAEVALLFDWENRWAMENAVVMADNVKYPKTCIAHYRAFWEQGVPVDVIDESCALSSYKLVVAPMLYLLRESITPRIVEYVRSGGTIVMTYWSGIVNENDLCYLGGWPGAGLREVFGVWDEELDVLQPFDENAIVMEPSNPLGLQGSYKARDLCTLIHAETAEVLATYDRDFYAGRPALTRNSYGDGTAYYVASRNESSLLNDLYRALIDQLGIHRVLETDLPRGVTAQLRTDGEREFVFLMNFTAEPQTLDLGDSKFEDMLNGRPLEGSIELDTYDVAVLERLPATRQGG